MDNSEQALCWTDQPIFYWTEKGIKLQAGISVDKIYDFEKLLDFAFPQDFVDLYKKVNGFQDFDWNEHMFSLWSLDRIVKEYQEDEDKNYVGFCDFLLNSHSIGFFKTDIGVYKGYDQTRSIANGFQDCILLLNLNDDLLY